MIAVAALSPTLRALVFLAAFVLFAVAAFGGAHPRFNLMAGGLAVFAIPFFWDALAAA